MLIFCERKASIQCHQISASRYSAKNVVIFDFVGSFNVPEIVTIEPVMCYHSLQPSLQHLHTYYCGIAHKVKVRFIATLHRSVLIGQTHWSTFLLHKNVFYMAHHSLFLKGNVFRALPRQKMIHLPLCRLICHSQLSYSTEIWICNTMRHVACAESGISLCQRRAGAICVEWRH